MDKNSKIYIAGHKGLVGSAILKKLQKNGFTNILTRGHSELDLIRQNSVESFFKIERPEYVFLSAARVGGILANSSKPANFLYENIFISANIIHSAYRYGVKKIINLGSSCIYPKLAPQPIKEEYLLTSPLESTNEAYALAKITALKMCRYYNEQFGTNYISAMPSNMYGPGDNYDLNSSHVLPAMIRKFHEGKLSGNPVILWGDGSPLREFLYSEDLADGLLFLLENVDYPEIGEVINIGSGIEITIKELADTIQEIIGFKGDVIWDTSKPNGTPRKLMDSTRIYKLGWRPKIDLRKGIELSYQDFIHRYY